MEKGRIRSCTRVQYNTIQQKEFSLKIMDYLVSTYRSLGTNSISKGLGGKSRGTACLLGRGESSGRASKGKESSTGLHVDFVYCTL
jgi:hypothetical protein